MTTPDQILLMLLADGAVTPAAIGDKLRIPMLVAKAVCERHERDGLVSHTLIADLLPLYQLTEAGKARAATLTV